MNNSTDMKDLAASNELMNYYQLLRTLYEQSVTVQKDCTKIEETPSENIHSSNKITQVARLEEPIIDLTISKSSSISSPSSASYQHSNININIENSMEPEKNALKFSPQSENNITINSAGVSINVSNSSRELKISCKTTPPKKRYSVYAHSDTVDADSNKVNLSAKFNVDSLVPVDVIASGSTVQQLVKYRPQNDSVGQTISDIMPSTKTDAVPITSTYLQLMRSMGLSDEDALKFDNLVSSFFYCITFLVINYV